VPELTLAGKGGPRARPSRLTASSHRLSEVQPLVVAGLDVRYGAVHAVADVAFDVPAGSVVGLLGPNGCGKSSTLRAVVGLLPPRGGRVVVNGVERGTVSARSQLAYVPDEPDGLDELAVVEYLALVRALYRESRAFDARALALGDAFGLSTRMRVRLGALSHGQRRVVSIVAALALVRPLTVVDEATAALDPEATIVLREALRAAAERGGGVLVATQDLAFAERVCDHVVLLNQGRVVARGGTRDLSPLEETFLAAVGGATRIEEVRGALRDL
jgi:ABC-2 type transport system ATP-binding protein